MPNPGGPRYRIHIRKEALKFSSAHMTVYPDGTKENLHGHNYRTELTVDLADANLDKMVSFSEFKTAMRTVCEQWDEKILLARGCPYLEIRSETEAELEFSLCGKRYALPADEVELLHTDNITTERLAELFCAQFLAALPAATRTKLTFGVQIKIEEISGQGATYFWRP